MNNDISSGSHEASAPSPAAWQDAPDLTEEERQVLAALKAAAEAMLAIPREAQVPFANPDKFSGPLGFLDNGLPSGGVAAQT